MFPIGLKPAPPNVPTAQLSQLVGYTCVGDRLKLRPWVGVDAANAHRPPRARAGATCVNAAAGKYRRATHNRGGTQAFRLGPLPMSYQRDAIASLAALAAADALAGAGRALSASRSSTSRSRTSRTGIGVLRVLAAATATRAAVGAAALAGVQRAIAVLGAATRPARMRRVGGSS